MEEFIQFRLVYSTGFGNLYPTGLIQPTKRADLAWGRVGVDDTELCHVTHPRCRAPLCTACYSTMSVLPLLQSGQESALKEEQMQ